MTASPIGERVREAVLDAAAVLLPVECAECDAADRGVCVACRQRLAPDPVLREVDGLSVWSGLRYEGTARRVLLAFKESGRTDVARVLVPALRSAVARAIETADAGRARPAGPRAAPADAGIELCAIPSSRAGRRRRGYDPVRLVAARADLPLHRLLVRSRRPGTAVQKSLGIAARADNAAGSLRARGRATGRRVVLVDDVVTSGATLREARRALVAAGAEVVGAAVIASTPRRQEARR